MSNTTLRIAEPLKNRLSFLAQATGHSTHSFMIETLSQKADALEEDLAFQALAMSRLADMEQNNNGLDWEMLKPKLLKRAVVITQSAMKSKP